MAGSGDRVTWTIVVTNSGTTRLVDVQVQDLLPDGMRYADSSPSATLDAESGYYGWNTALGAGETQTFSLAATIDDTAAAPFANSACAAGVDAMGGRAEECADASVSAAPTATPVPTSTPAPSGGGGTGGQNSTATPTPTAATLTPSPTSIPTTMPTSTPTPTPTVETAGVIATPPPETVERRRAVMTVTIRILFARRAVLPGPPVQLP